MKNKLVNIKLHGRLGEEVGSDWNFDIKNVAEGFRAIEIMSKYRFTKTLSHHQKEGINYRILINGRDFVCDQKALKKNPINTIRNSEIFLNKRDLRSIDIVPVIEGALFTAIFVIVMILVAVAIYFLTPLPQFSDFREIDGTIGKTSYLFNGPQNTSREGGPVQIGYGRLIVGSQVIASSYSIKNIPASSLDIVVPGAGDTGFDLKDRMDRTLYQGINYSLDYGAIAMHTETGEGAYLITASNGRIIKISSDGSLIRTLSYNPNIPFKPNIIHVLSDNSILVANGNKLYKFVYLRPPNTKDANGVILDTYALATDTFGTNGVITANSGSNIYSICSIGTNFIIIGGSFTTIDGGYASRIAALNEDGTLRSTFSTPRGFDKTVRTIIKDASTLPCNIFVGGEFLLYNNGSGTSTAKQLVKININASFISNLDATFDVSTGPTSSNGNASDNDIIYALGLQTLTSPVNNAGKLIVGGTFNFFKGSKMTKVCRLNTTGTLDTGFTNLDRLTTVGAILAILIQSNDKIIMGGSFNGNTSNSSEIGMRGLCRLNLDGKLDITFDSGGGDNGGIRGGGNNPRVLSIINEVGKNRIYIAGDFTHYNSDSDNFPAGIARVKVD